MPLLLDAGVLSTYFSIRKIFFLGFTTLGTKYDSLLTTGAEVNRQRWTDGWTPLHLAAMMGLVEVAVMLLQVEIDD